MADPTETDAGGEGIVRTMTVAELREPAGADHVEVMFYESARFYRLQRKNALFAQAIGLLRRSAATGQPVAVTMPSIDSDVIARVAATA